MDALPGVCVGAPQTSTIASSINLFGYIGKGRAGCNLHAHSVQQSSAYCIEEDKVMETRELCRQFCSHPWQLRDNWPNKTSSSYPHLEHVTSLKALWMDGWWHPPLMDINSPSLNNGIPHFDRGVCRDYTADLAAPSAHYLRIGNFGSLSALCNFCDEGPLYEVLQVVTYMDQQGLCIANRIICRLLQRCINENDLGAGRELHCLIIKCGFELDAFLASQLIQMFASFQTLREANKIFNKLSEPNVYLWNAIISAHVKLGQNERGIELYHHMIKSSVQPNGHIFVAVLKACSSIESSQQGKLIHSRIIEGGVESDVYIGNTLVDMYAKCGNIEDACREFGRLPMQDVVTWNTLIVGYTQHGHCQEALQLFDQMHHEGIEPNRVTFVSILKASSSIAALEQGRHIHTHIIESGYETGTFVGNTLIDMYTKSGDLEGAHAVYERLPKRDVVSWSALIAGYADHGCGLEALQLYKQMLCEGIEPDRFTFVSILKACFDIASLEQARQIHNTIIESELESDMYISSTLIDVYTKLGSLEDARVVFDRLQKRNVVTWSVLMEGYTRTGHSQEAFDLFQQMKWQGVNPDPVVYASMLKACSGIAGLQQGRWIHSNVVESGFELDQFLSSTLIDLYIKYGSLEDAHAVFDRLPERNVVMWSVLITGFNQHGHSQKSLQLFEQMRQEGVLPDQAMFVGVLKACSSVAALGKGRQIHAFVIELGLQLDIFVGSALVDMYAKCGSLDDACLLFEILPDGNVVTWNTIIAGSAQHNNYMLAFRYFEEMQLAGLKPQGITFLCLLAASNHMGLVDEGCCHFKSIREDFGILPTLEHYNSMVDLFGHAGHWKEAEDLVETIPYGCNVVGWISLLSSCRTLANVELGRKCFNNVVTIDPGRAAAYVLMANIYAHAGMWQDAEKVEELRRFSNGWKKPGKAFVEIDNHLYDFTVGEKSHPQSDEIYAKLKTLSVQLRDEGYRPCLDLVLDSTSEQNKEDALCGHCEKLAIAFGLICTPQGTSIRIAKNLRMCADCHNAAKIISKLELREIIVLDAYCVHKFTDGACSCRDYH